ncbi:MAG: hypothetical protein KF760_17895 [Candidatus Eremiobacteraeota bacterium]|nr:hypothetical protein [Candidatus Eremiobacteraeota bacterium]MCW5869254.1 hypothetical protein [Candidatus Eremiobacteraeota bacterium]
MSYAARIARLEKIVKTRGAAPCPACRQKKSAEATASSDASLEQWHWIWAAVFGADSVAFESAMKDLLCPRCGRCGISWSECADAYYLANQDSEIEGEQEHETYE